MKKDLSERLLKFSVDIFQFLKTVSPNIENNVIRYQLAKSSTSAGANYEEAQAGSTRPDFNRKVDIALKEMRESNYWLKVLNALQIGDQNLLNLLIKESLELKLILGSIAAKTAK